MRAAVRSERIQRAELVVLDEQVDEEPLAAAPRPLHPLVVGALVGQRVGGRPVDEGRPADRVVGRFAGQDRLERVAAGLVVLAVDEGVRRTEPVPRLAAVGAAAEELVRHAVGVGVGVPAHLLVRRDAGERVAADVDLRLGVGGAAGGAGEQEAAAPLDAERLAAAGERVRSPVIRAVQIVSRRALRPSRLPAHELTLGVVEEVLAERGRLEEEGFAARRRGCSSRSPSRSGSVGGAARGRSTGVVVSAGSGVPRPAATAVALATFSAALVGSWAFREVVARARQGVLGRGVVVPVGLAAVRWRLRDYLGRSTMTCCTDRS